MSAHSQEPCSDRHRCGPQRRLETPSISAFKEAAIKTLNTPSGEVAYRPLTDIADADTLARLPYVLRVFLENVLRHQGRGAGPEHIEALLAWPKAGPAEFPYHPSRVVLQDFTGVPCVADLAAIRGAVARLGGDASAVNPRIPADLVIDHSVIVDAFGNAGAFARNVEMEYSRNGERYTFLRWAQGVFNGLSVVPPGAGIVHQVNLEFLARVVMTAEVDGVLTAFPDTLVGTDSHTTMIGGLGVLGWGVGGIEAEAALLGEPVSMLVPTVVGLRLDGTVPEGCTATDLVLAVTQLLRGHGVVGKFVEFFGPGLGQLSVADRATIANMSPEYGATEGVFPVDEQTLAYLRSTGRDEAQVALVEAYCKAQGLFHSPDDHRAGYDETLSFDLSSLKPSVAGPKRPQDLVHLDDLKDAFNTELELQRSRSSSKTATALAPAKVEISIDGKTSHITDGSVVIAAITSCTNTSNPSVMVASGLLARNALARGLSVDPSVKTSLAPGSPVVIDYLRKADLLDSLDGLGFYLVGYGCTTCIGNSGPLPDAVAAAVDSHDLSVAAVLSGNRNFEGRIHPQVRMSFLASPPLVVAYALAGTVNIDLTTEPLGTDRDGNDVFLRDIWPSPQEIAETVLRCLDPSEFQARASGLFAGDQQWKDLPTPTGNLYEWDAASTYIQEPPFCDVDPTATPVKDIVGARVLALLGDSVTTDHISPAGTIPRSSPAGQWLSERGVTPDRLHSYGARRGNHHVMVRGTFANIRLRNALVPGVDGGYTRHFGDDEQLTIFEAAERYEASGVPLVIVAGKEYGSGSSRDWAAKGTLLLGVRAVFAESFERIHRANLVQMGVLPLELPSSASDLGLDGTETFDLRGLADLKPGATVEVLATRPGGREIKFQAKARLDTQTDVRYYSEGGILPAVVREILSRGSSVTCS